jgi:hypothetical protein
VEAEAAGGKGVGAFSIGSPSPVPIERLYPVEILGDRDHQDRGSHDRLTGTVWVVLLGVLLLGFTVADSSALSHRTTQAGKTSAPLCRGKVKRVRPAHVGFSFECGNEDVTAFIVQANRALHFVYDPSYASAANARHPGRSPAKTSTPVPALLGRASPRSANHSAIPAHT